MKKSTTWKIIIGFFIYRVDMLLTWVYFGCKELDEMMRDYDFMENKLEEMRDRYYSQIDDLIVEFLDFNNLDIDYLKNNKDMFGLEIKYDGRKIYKMNDIPFLILYPFESNDISDLDNQKITFGFKYSKLWEGANQ